MDATQLEDVDCGTESDKKHWHRRETCRNCMAIAKFSGAGGGAGG